VSEQDIRVVVFGPLPDEEPEPAPDPLQHYYDAEDAAIHEQHELSMQYERDCDQWYGPGRRMQSFGCRD
jgi:hypothetical protein